MNEELLQELRRITPEEQRILDGSKQIESTIYMSADPNVVDAGKLLEHGKLITMRPSTRFVYFPKHTHNYIEVVYMCEGMTHHVIDGRDVILRKGELLFLSLNAVQELYPAGFNDIAVNFIVLPEFFDVGLSMMKDDNRMRDFIVDSLRSEKSKSGYLHFHVADVLPIQNLVENLIWTLWNKEQNKRSINQITMGLLFLLLSNHIDRVETGERGADSSLKLEVLQYVEEHYKDGGLTDLAEELHYDVYWLSKEIKRVTGHNYTELVQQKRLNQAVYLLETTSMSVLDVGQAVGYDNQSYFHRIFQKKYGTTPRKYRLEHGKVSRE